MVLDAVLVISLPQEYKLAGAAVATALSQVVGGGVPLLYFAKKNSSILRLGKCRFDGRILLRACVNGSSEFMSNISMNLVGMIFSAAFIGYSIGIAPVVGYHDGAKNHSELQGLLKKSLLMIGMFGVAMVAAAEALAWPLARLFVGYDPELTRLTAEGFRIFGLCFFFMGYAIFSSGFFTALNDGVTSAIISFLRTLVFQVAAVLLLSSLWGITGIWISIIVAEFMAVLLSALFLMIKRIKYHYWAG